MNRILMDPVVPLVELKRSCPMPEEDDDDQKTY